MQMDQACVNEHPSVGKALEVVKRCGLGVEPLQIPGLFETGHPARVAGPRRPRLLLVVGVEMTGELGLVMGHLGPRHLVLVVELELDVVAPEVLHDAAAGGGNHDT